MAMRKRFDLAKFPTYSGKDLGASYTATKTTFKVWAPTASMVVLRLYSTGHGPTQTHQLEMESSSDGVWILEFEGNIINQYYTYQATINGEFMKEVADPYTQTTGVDGVRGMVIDLEATNPDGWNNDVRPPLKSFNDIIIWETHIRDLSISATSGIANKGKFLGVTEAGTTSPEGQKTGLDHIIDLGVTHIHFLPLFDFEGINETQLELAQYNWGYNPRNFNSPNGSYSTNPYDGNVRVKEFKEMIKVLHNKGIRVIMDVVYNHTCNTGNTPFEQLVPGYYYRLDSRQKFANGSGCGNETASDHPMFRKYMVDSIKYWAQEYHIDGFRFDLMAIHDIETMKLIRSELTKIDSTIFIYGEGWTAGRSPLNIKLRATKEQTNKLNGIAVFSDEFRDGLRGRGFKQGEQGYICDNPDLRESIKYGIVGGVNHSQVDYSKVIHSGISYVNSPSQFIGYASCHDNYCLWDRICATTNDLSEMDRLRIQKLANGIVLTSQGIPFLHAGEEIVRTKQMVENSYKSADNINGIDWSRKSKYLGVYNYYKEMVELRKNHPAFRMTNTAEINKNLTFLNVKSPSVIGYQISNHANGDVWEKIIVYINPTSMNVEVMLPDGNWQLVANGSGLLKNGIEVNNGNTKIPARTMNIFKLL